jgi:flagellar basal-body rod protein FlgG
MSDSVKNQPTPDSSHFDPINVDFTEGPISQTDRSLDFALRGNGFFVVSNGEHEYYTRKGDFHLEANGNLVTADGFAVQGTAGSINIPRDSSAANIATSDDGTLSVGGKTIAKLRIVSFPNQSVLARAGTTFFSAPAEVTPEESDGSTKVISKFLEESNTTVFEEMADLVSCMRNFEACQRMIRSNDENIGKMIQQYSG